MQKQGTNFKSWNTSVEIFLQGSYNLHYSVPHVASPSNLQQLWVYSHRRIGSYIFLSEKDINSQCPEGIHRIKPISLCSCVLKYSSVKLWSFSIFISQWLHRFCIYFIQFTSLNSFCKCQPSKLGLKCKSQDRFSQVYTHQHHQEKMFHSWSYIRKAIVPDWQ